MKKIFSILLLCFMLSLLSACGMKKTNVNSADSYTVTDARGIAVKIPHKPQRIVTLAIYTDQITLGLVHSNRMAAINKYLDDPKESTIVEKAKKIKYKVTNPGTEQMLSWQPDLIIATAWTPIEMIEAYSELGIPVIVCNQGNNYEEIQECVSLISEAVGEKEKGRQMLARMNEELTQTKEKLKNIPQNERKKVLLISVMTDFGGIGSCFDDMCKHAGVINSMATAGIKNGQNLTKEMIIKCNPDVIFLPNYDNHGSFDIQEFVDSYLKDPAMKTVPAIKNNELYVPRDCYLYNCSQDFVYGVQEIAYCAYGDEFKIADGLNISLSGE